MSKVKGQSLILKLAGTAIACEKSCKLSYSNEFEDCTTKETEEGKKEEEHMRTNISISFDCLVGDLTSLNALKTKAKNGTPVAYVIQSKDSSPVEIESGYAVFDSFDIDATNRQNVSASGSMHDVYYQAS